MIGILWIMEEIMILVDRFLSNFRNCGKQYLKLDFGRKMMKMRPTIPIHISLKIAI
jgi:hypothetical protein